MSSCGARPDAVKCWALLERPRPALDLDETFGADTSCWADVAALPEEEVHLRVLLAEGIRMPGGSSGAEGGEHLDQAWLRTCFRRQSPHTVENHRRRSYWKDSDWRGTLASAAWEPS